LAEKEPDEELADDDISNDKEEIEGDPPSGDERQPYIEHNPNPNPNP